MGSVGFLHRFGSFLNPHFHFREATTLTSQFLENLQHTSRKWVLRPIRYCARPPFALDRLQVVNGRSDQTLYLLPGPDLAGRTALRLSALEFLDRLATSLPSHATSPPPGAQEFPLPAYFKIR